MRKVLPFLAGLLLAQAVNAQVSSKIQYEAIYDCQTKTAAPVVTAFFETFTGITKNKYSIDLYSFAGADVKGRPLTGFAARVPVKVADQLSLFIGPAFEMKQGSKSRFTLFAGITLK